MADIKKLDITKEPVTRKAKLKEKLQKLPDKKPHLDFIAAILSIPVLLTVLTLNIMSLQSKSAKPTPTPSPVPTQTMQKNTAITPVVISTAPLPTTNPSQCTPGISPISIDFPTEGQTISNNPVCISINPNQGNYCSSVWAYKINNSALSDYSNNSVCLYNLPAGQNTFQLSVHSLSSPATATITRNFTVKATITPSMPSPTTATSSAQ